MSKLPQSSALKASALIGALGVALGAFGAHGLEELLIENGRVDTWETAAFYHLVHAVVLLVLATRKQWHAGPWLAMAIGIIIFSGSLYLLSLTNVGWLGAITPIGGLSLLAGWIWIGFGAKD
ncbi:MAG: DUF423 domain-containing protein [Puniceicoccaceae bacterium]